MFFLYPVSTLWGEITMQEENWWVAFILMRAKSFFCVFAAFRRHSLLSWAKLLCHLFKCHAIFRLNCLDPQCSLDPTAFQRLLPAGRIVTEICAAPSAFASRINRHTPVGITHQAKQPTLRVSAPACDTCSHRDMLWSWPGCFFLCLCHNSMQYAVSSKLVYLPTAYWRLPTCLFLFHCFVGGLAYMLVDICIDYFFSIRIYIYYGRAGLHLLVVEHIRCDQPITAINV